MRPAQGDVDSNEMAVSAYSRTTIRNYALTPTTAAVAAEPPGTAAVVVTGADGADAAFPHPTTSVSVSLKSASISVQCCIAYRSLLAITCTIVEHGYENNYEK